MGLLSKLFDMMIFPFRSKATTNTAKYLFNHQILGVLKEANDWFNISKNMEIMDLHEKRAFRGLINEYLRSDSFYPSVVDIAVSINIASDCYCSENPSKYESDIIDLAFHISTEIQKILTFDPVLKLAIKNLGKCPSKIDTQADREDIQILFKDKKILFKHYFMSFCDCRYKYAIKVWHEGNDKTWIEWTEADSIVVNVNPVRIREGFFLTGFDYTDLRQDKLMMVASNIGGYEYFDKIQDNKSIVWAR